MARDQARGAAGRAFGQISAALMALVAFGFTSGPVLAGSDVVTSGLPVPRFVSLKADRVTVRGDARLILFATHI